MRLGRRRLGLAAAVSAGLVAAIAPAALAASPGAAVQGPYGQLYAPAAEPTGGFTSVSEVLSPVNDPESGLGQAPPAYFYARQFAWDGQAGGGYVGMQTDRNGKRALMSIWGPTIECQAGPGGGATQMNHGFDGGQSGGCQVQIPLSWVPGHSYRLTVNLISSGAHDVPQALWEATVVDLTTADSRIIGYIGVPEQTPGLLDEAVNWIEYYGPAASSCEQYPYAAARWTSSTAWSPRTGTVGANSASTWKSNQGSCASGSQVSPGPSLTMSEGFNIDGVDPYQP